MTKYKKEIIIAIVGAVVTISVAWINGYFGSGSKKAPKPTATNGVHIADSVKNNDNSTIEIRIGK
jgi:hypothetical protein